MNLCVDLIRCCRMCFTTSPTLNRSPSRFCSSRRATRSANFARNSTLVLPSSRGLVWKTCSYPHPHPRMRRRRMRLVESTRPSTRLPMYWLIHVVLPYRRVLRRSCIAKRSARRMRNADTRTMGRGKHRIVARSTTKPVPVPVAALAVAVVATRIPTIPTATTPTPTSQPNPHSRREPNATRPDPRKNEIAPNRVTDRNHQPTVHQLRPPALPVRPTRRPHHPTATATSNRPSSLSFSNSPRISKTSKTKDVLRNQPNSPILPA